MGLVIEISINIKRVTDVNGLKLYLSELAYNHNCLSEYFQYESEGKNSFIERNHCIQVVEFDEPFTDYEIKNILKYVNIVRKKQYIKIDTIYYDTGKITKIYSSKNYENQNMNYDFIQNNKPISLILKDYLLR
tara:strand:+ start:280 stop:678 length:399 start_codon:yes stop_codon:yes gene_type:complete